MGQAARHAIVFGRQLTKEERIAEIERVTTADVRRILAEMAATQPTLVAAGSTDAPAPEEITARFAALRGAA